MPIFLNVREKQIAESHAFNSLLPGLSDKFFHDYFILRITARIREIDDMQRETDSLCLALQQFQPHGMDGNASIDLIHRGHQPRDFQIGSLAQHVKRPRAVFATAPT